MPGSHQRKPAAIAAMAHTLGRMAVLAAIVSVSACSSTDDEDAAAAFETRPLDVLYAEAYTSLRERSYRAAVQGFEEVELQHPFSPWAPRAIVMAAYASYKSADFAGAIAMAERFLKANPAHELAPYAYYLIALSHYEQISDVGRDQKATRDAMRALEEVARRFPDTMYARDARFKLDLTRDHLAGKEMAVGRYYQKRGDFVGAIGRFQYVITQYQTTSHVPEALFRLTETYLAMGVTTEARRNAAVLGHNFPASRWYRDAYALMHRHDPSLKRPESAATPDA